MAGGAGGARCGPIEPLRFLPGLLCREILELEPGAVAAGAPALRRVERQQARIGLGKAAATVRTRAPAGEHLHAAPGPQYMGDAVARLQSGSERGTQLRFAPRIDREFRDGQLDVVFDEALERRKRIGRYPRTLDAPVAGAARGGPACPGGRDGLSLWDQGWQPP